MANITIETRNESFDKIIATIGDRQRVVIDYLEAFDEPLSASDIAYGLYINGLVPTPERNSVHPRLTELTKMGIVRVVGKEKDQVTNRKVAVYELVEEARQ
ncbi:MAG: hypothetical protein L0L09_04735 [Staphylococcus equorum]|nr:hypothetical protein [Lactococcus lactis]MDN6160826.1 hypothetical protein [Staphylococcus equorum]MDN6120306.1 hypothetical protein [Lactococcus lactis]MDN6505451.1 hypothetical protein [Lactococcus lactis]MDN6569873.1 hypothetical protein [Staphylococcus equorum]